MSADNVYNELYGLIYRLTLRVQDAEKDLLLLTANLREQEKEITGLKNFRSCYDPTYRPFNIETKK